MRPSAVSSQASIIATLILPKNPERIRCAIWDRCISEYLTCPLLQAFRKSVLVVYGALKSRAFALVNTPSHESPVEAPVRTLTLNCSPRECFSSAIFANSAVTALGVPAGVNPLKPMMSPSLIKLAASAAVINL